MHRVPDKEEITVKRGIFVGRFQPPHKGHLGAIKNILKKVDELVIIVGSSQYSHRPNNPFTTGERITMIRKALEEEGIQPSRYWIIPVPDVQLHMLWVSQIVGYSPKFELVYTNEPLTRRLFIEAGFKVEPVPFIKRKIYSATEIRKRMLNGENWEELVPKSVGRFIKEVDGIARLSDLTKTDVVT
jgi:nicotinamide-nucleotide adenylyltransferase